MTRALDALDRKILAALQADATRPLEELAAHVGASKTPVWNRIQRLRREGVITRQVAIVEPTTVGLGVCFFVLVKTSRHEAAWLETFLEVLRSKPQVLEAHRLAGEIDYILKVRTESVDDYDDFYRSLISEVSIYNVTSVLSMEEIKYETALPISQAPDASAKRASPKPPKPRGA